MDPLEGKSWMFKRHCMETILSNEWMNIGAKMKGHILYGQSCRGNCAAFVACVMIKYHYVSQYYIEKYKDINCSIGEGTSI